MRIPLKLATVMIAAAMAFLQGCNDDSNNGDDAISLPDKQFQLDVTNLTHNQAISAVGVILHDSAYQLFTLGEAATVALEELAEGGDNSALLSEANSNGAVIDTVAGTAMIVPGSSERFMLGGNASALEVSLAGMLVNTNDGFAALNGAAIGHLERGASVTFHAKVFDAGSEGNSEAAAELPGQGGEGFNAARNDRDFVTVHPGVLSMVDGLATSALDQSHRFDNPALKVVVTRLQ